MFTVEFPNQFSTSLQVFQRLPSPLCFGIIPPFNEILEAFPSFATSPNRFHFVKLLRFVNGFFAFFVRNERLKHNTILLPHRYQLLLCVMQLLNDSRVSNLHFLHHIVRIRSFHLTDFTLRIMQSQLQVRVSLARNFVLAFEFG